MSKSKRVTKREKKNLAPPRPHVEAPKNIKEPQQEPCACGQCGMPSFTKVLQFDNSTMEWSMIVTPPGWFAFFTMEDDRPIWWQFCSEKCAREWIARARLID